MAMWIKIEDWLTPMEYSRHIRKSMTWVTKLMQTGKVQYIRYSGGRLIHKSGKMPTDNNPIKDNRIVCDQTFAVRLKDFIDNVDVCDLPGEEEKEYLQSVASELIKYQVETATDDEEIKYLKNIGLK